jgi:glyoxylase-like metal-dependent hydrolase (beta-lactamase superfamily II)
MHRERASRPDHDARWSADVVEPDAELGDGLRLAPAPDHTPGHVALWLDGGGRPAVMRGLVSPAGDGWRFDPVAAEG